MRRGRSPSRVLRRTAIRIGVRRIRARLVGVPLAERRRATGRELAAALGELRGIYAKLGQYLALRSDVIPDEIREELQTLTDSAPASPFPAIRRALEEGLGPIGQRFAWIDPNPIGSASIAQVHRAHMIAEGVVAVKVRHPELTPERLETDLRILRRALRRLRRRLGLREVDRMLEPLAETLREELDLEREGRIAEEIRANLADDPRIVVPRVHWGATGPNVLTVDYVPWIRLDDPAGLEAAGVRPEQCLAILAEAYGRQVFDQGLFHADPHPGNVFLVDESSPQRPPGDTRPRLLFLDFGLSKRLAESLRAELREGIHALLRRDVDALLAGLGRIGALVPGREAEAEAAIRQALDAGAAEALSATPSTIEALKELGKQLLRESRAFRVPTELLLYARTLAYVFALSERIAPGHSPMPQLLPRLLGFLAGGDRAPVPPPTASGASAAGRSAG